MEPLQCQARKPLSLRAHAHPCFVGQPNRSLVFHPSAAGASIRLVRERGPPDARSRGLRLLLERAREAAVPLAILGQLRGDSTSGCLRAKFRPMAPAKLTVDPLIDLEGT